MSKYKTILSCGSIEQLTKMINDYFYSDNYSIEFPNLINNKKEVAFLNQFIISFKISPFKNVNVL